MPKKTVIPFGPQHPVLPEPIHLDLVMEDEKVVEAVPSIGFIHRGLEGLVAKKDFNEMVYVAERICGICSFQHGMGYCEAVERTMGAEVPRRARLLRTLWAETSRIHSHLLWLGLLADGFGFEALFNQAWRIRESILDIVEATTGGRVISSVNKVGGVRRDIDEEMGQHILRTIDQMEKETRTMVKTFLSDYTVKSRLVGSGVLSKQEVIDLGAVGPMARASGVAVDLRTTGYAAYDEIEFEPITSQDGDGYARCQVRIEEIFQSYDIVRQVVEKLKDAEETIYVKPKGNPNGEHMMRVEQPRGEVFYYVHGNGTKFIDRFRVRTPTFANLPALLKTLQGADMADVPLLVLTIDPCISCTER